jgi:hypothetical protein
LLSYKKSCLYFYTLEPSHPVARAARRRARDVTHEALEAWAIGGGDVGMHAEAVHVGAARPGRLEPATR